MRLNHRGVRKIARLQFWHLLGLCVCGAALTLRVCPRETGQSKASGEPSPKTTTSYSSSLGHEIRHQLATLPFYSVFDFITFTLDGKKVTLSGQVLRPTLKRHAEAAVQSLEGVDTVSNQLEVLPNSPTDDDLRRGIYRAIYEDPQLAPYAVQTVPPIHIIVKNGAVSLEGTVKSAADRELAATRAKNVLGAASVKNNLRVSQEGNEAERGDVR